jgi:ABC-2 type transport system ATP-binding protein
MTDIPIEARALVKRYGDITAVDHVDLTVRAGDVYGYLGPNGAGKTTSLRMLLGLIRPDEGAARLFGRDPLLDGARALDGVAGFVEEPRFYPYLSGRRNLDIWAAHYGGEARSRIPSVLERVALSDRAGDKVKTYSLGMRQRLGVARALLNDPELLVLDEPTNGMDPAAELETMDILRALHGGGRLAIVMVSHRLEAVANQARTLAFVDQDKALFRVGSLEEMLRPEALGALYGRPVAVREAEGRRWVYPLPRGEGEAR